MTDSTRLKPSACLSCGTVNDMAASASDRHSKPSPGDISICLRCGHLGAYDDDLGIRELTVAEQIEVAGDPIILRAQRARAATEPKP